MTLTGGEGGGGGGGRMIPSEINNTNCYVKYDIKISCDLQYNQFNLSIGLYLSYYTTLKHECPSHSSISSVIL